MKGEPKYKYGQQEQVTVRKVHLRNKTTRYLHFRQRHSDVNNELP